LKVERWLNRALGRLLARSAAAVSAPSGRRRAWPR